MDVMLFNLLYFAVRALILLILIDVILSWIPTVDRWHPLVLTLRRIVGPLYAPFRRILPPEKTGNIDFSPLLLVVALNLALQLLGWILI